MSKGESAGNGQSAANGPSAPVWLRDWQMRELQEAKVSFWSVQA